MTVRSIAVTVGGVAASATTVKDPKVAVDDIVTQQAIMAATLSQVMAGTNLTVTLALAASLTAQLALISTDATAIKQSTDADMAISYNVGRVVTKTQAHKAVQAGEFIISSLSDLT